jgi:N-dimethylarginine dimethylaminohydrolase
LGLSGRLLSNARGTAFRNSATIEKERKELAWTRPPDPEVAARQHRKLVSLLEAAGHKPISFPWMIERVIPVPLPYWTGPEEVLHLMWFMSLLDTNLAVVYRRLLPVPLFELLVERGVELVDVPERNTCRSVAMCLPWPRDNSSWWQVTR